MYVVRINGQSWLVESILKEGEWQSVVLVKQWNNEKGWIYREVGIPNEWLVERRLIK